MENRTLLIIDVQEGSILRRVSYKQLVYDFLKTNHREYDNIIATKYTYDEDSLFKKDLGWLGFKKDGDYDIIPEVLKYSNKILEKTTYNCLNIEMKEYIEKKGIKNLDIIGMDTDACVLATAISLFDYGISPRVLSRLCTTTGDMKLHYNTLDIMERKERNLGKINVVRT